MGFLNEVRDKASEAADKAGEAASKTRVVLDEKTGGRLSQAADKVKEKLPTDRVPGADRIPGLGDKEPEADKPDEPGQP